MISSRGGSRPWARLELGLGVAAAFLSVVCLCYLSRDAWFRSDAWDFLLFREAGSIDSWLRPHTGHLQWIQVGLYRLLYGTVGLDFWPWYHVPYLVAYAAVMFYLWRALLRRGADRLVAFTAYLVLLLLGVSGFLSLYAVGAILVLPALAIVAERVDADPEPSAPTRWVVVVASVVMATTTSTGAVGLAACLVAVTVRGRLRRWWWCFLPAIFIYGAWYGLYAAGDAAGAIDWGRVIHVPAQMIALLGLATKLVTGVGGGATAWGVVTGSVLVGVLGWLIWRRRVRIWDLVFVGTLIGYMLVVILVRGQRGSMESVGSRYTFMVVMLLTLWLIPHLRFGEGRPGAVRVVGLLVVGGWLLGYNAWQRVDWGDWIEVRTLEARSGVEAVAAVIQAGEPAIDSLRLERDLGIDLTWLVQVRDVRRLLDDGWEPSPAAAEQVDAMRMALRMHDAARVRGNRGLAPMVLPGARENGCVALAGGESVRAEVIGTGWLAVVPVGDGWHQVRLVWQDGFGEFLLSLSIEGRQVVQLASPVGDASLTIENGGGQRARVCSLGEVPG